MGKKKISMKNELYHMAAYSVNQVFDSESETEFINVFKYNMTV